MQKQQVDKPEIGFKKKLLTNKIISEDFDCDLSSVSNIVK